MGLRCMWNKIFIICGLSKDTCTYRWIDKLSHLWKMSFVTINISSQSGQLGDNNTKICSRPDYVRHGHCWWYCSWWGLILWVKVRFVVISYSTNDMLQCLLIIFQKYFRKGMKACRKQPVLLQVLCNCCGI